MHEYKEQPGECAACGNSPVNHIATYLLQSTDLLVGSIAYRVARRFSAPRWALRVSQALERLISKCFFAVAEKVRIVTYNTDPTKARSYRSQVIWEEALRRGIPMEQVVVWGKATGIYRAFVRGAWQYFNSIPIPAEIDRPSAWWMGDKHLVKEHLRPHGIAVPQSQSISRQRDALAAHKAIGRAVIIKPQIGSRGRHTTTHINDEKSVVEAFRSATQLCPRVSIEEHLEGPVCRGTVVAGKLVGFFQGTVPHVVGNGKETIERLIEAQNARRHERVAAIVLTDENDLFLSRQGYTRGSIPLSGAVVELTHRTGRLFGGETRELLSTVHPHLKAELERAADIIDTPIVGFDLIIADPEVDPRGQRWGIIEANSLPFIDLHYLPLYGTPSNPAAAVWDLWV
ncbi:MAG: hypothetical protein A2675_01000 [Candidatus Yonathbacteria bacterium RIFCSPHIGHO2_01_FULL_51_10]|uniref:ATP-grasp domain-containing protein n=1 Tax=Candidatus Yonathbacteria bacterium RIFCSPHIGHO2_01_FULL_51_10 TaxID=1802723 RepID=A0A1G2S8V7_9BACT|nr:MAG: hypothetical protein A2675_01000 [Candidatus Yonathbacteria bacterium RIFCSPHIGHO2_01_FULL_51_10]